jgi:hypothetical protein
MPKIRYKVASITVSLMVLLLAIVGMSRDMHAQNERQTREILDYCVDIETVDDTTYYIVNNCGVRIHADWGFWDKDSDSGIMQYSADIDVGQKSFTKQYTAFYAVGCPYTPRPGFPYGWKLTYRSNLGRTVTSYSHINSLVCVEW